MDTTRNDTLIGQGMSRMKRFEELRAKIKREVEMSPEQRELIAMIDNYKNKLNKLDGEYFADRIDNFVDEFNWEATVMEKDISQQPYDEEMHYDMQNEIEHMQTQFVFDNEHQTCGFKYDSFHKHNETVIMSNETNLIYDALVAEPAFNNTAFKKYKKINENLNHQKEIYVAQVNAIAQRLQVKPDASGEISISLVQKIRQKDKRSVNAMLRDVRDNVEDKSNRLFSKMRVFKTPGHLWAIFVPIGVLVALLMLLLMLFV